jgi:hypothetical protein
MNTALTSWTGDLSSLTIGSNMFNNCSKLTTFNSDLSSLTDGEYMFCWCSKLTSFSSNLSSLTDGNRMFHVCSLDAPSIKNIGLTINKNVTNNPRFDIGMDITIENDEQVKKDLGLIKHKGWNLWINGGSFTTDYTLPKYAGCGNLLGIRIEDSNYKTNDIVNGAWTEHLPDLVNGLDEEGSSMFAGCSTLESFCADLSSLMSG